MTVNAKSQNDAIDICQSEASFDGYCGNGDCDKLIGTNDTRISLDGSSIESISINNDDIVKT